MKKITAILICCTMFGCFTVNPSDYGIEPGEYNLVAFYIADKNGNALKKIHFNNNIPMTATITYTDVQFELTGVESEPFPLPKMYYKLDNNKAGISKQETSVGIWVYNDPNYLWYIFVEI